MAADICPFESDVKTAVRQGQWPHNCPAEMAAHLRHCASCSALALLEATVLQARAHSLAQLQLPSAGAVWWRAQIRRRQLQVARQTMPLRKTRLIALPLYLIAFLAFSLWQFRHGAHWSTAFHDFGLPSANAHTGLAGSLTGFALVFVTLGGLTLLGSILVLLLADKPLEDRSERKLSR
jgi:hypothetical protein